MWIRRKTYDEMVGRALMASGESAAMQRQVDSQKTTLDWLMHRLTQLEYERAQLIHRYMGVTIAVPVLEPEKPQTDTASVISNDLPSFNDVGDEAAKKLGLDWTSDGRVTEHGKVIS